MTTTPAMRPSQHKAATFLNHFVSSELIPQRKIVVGFGSAGGNLAVGLVGYSIHPHPAVSKLLLKPGDVFRGAPLMSPRVTFDTNSASMMRNVKRGYICRSILRIWHEAFMDGAVLDAYTMDTPMEWRQGLHVKLILAGGGELTVQ